jgi:adenosylcobinamide kinase/adenosylcobinamide-phosphate guanylyltransferase
VNDSPNSARIILVGGGARSGKSRFALEYARRLGQRPVFVATAQGLDDEMRARIAQHQEERGATFTTVEAPLALPEALRELQGEVVVVDCLTLWLSNLLMAGLDAAAIDGRLEALEAALARRRFHALVVSNEVGMGVVPETPLGRLFRDLTGRAHQRLARAADEIYLAAMGIILRVHPGPVERAG